MSTSSSTSIVNLLARLVIQNQKGIARACSYVVRRVKAVTRFVRTSIDNGEVFAMYVRSRDQTWACVLTGENPMTSRVIACEGCVLDRMSDVVLAPHAFSVIIDQIVETDLVRTIRPINRTNTAFIRTLDKYIPVAAVEAAVILDTSDAHFRRWRKVGSEELDRVDAIHVSVVDQTWALVTESGSARLVVLRGHHLDNLDQVYENRLTAQTAFIVSDV